MIYQLNGKLGPFTLEADNDQHIIALLYKIANDHSVYTTNPILLKQNLDSVEFKLKLQEIFTSVNEYIDTNIDFLIAIALEYLPGYIADREQYNKERLEILQDSSLEDADVEFLTKMLKETYQLKNEELTKRMQQVASLLQYRENELNPITVDALAVNDEDAKDELDQAFDALEEDLDHE
jgi:hypothetical protein